MQGQHFLQSLIDLIEFDRGLIKKSHEVDALKKIIAKLEQSQAQLVKAHEAVTYKVTLAKKVVHDCEREMKELDEREKNKKQLLEQTDTQKTYDALKKEISFLKKEQYDLEKQLVQQWKELEAAQKTFDDSLVAFNTKTAELSSDVHAKKETNAALEKELETLNVIRAEKESLVPAEWLTKYNRMRAQTDNPIVRVEFDSCGGCFAQLTPQALLDLKRKKLTQCNSCYRFLYQPDDDQSIEPEADKQT